MEFRDYQIELATTTIDNRRNLNLLNIAPTGSGKTITFCLLILKAIELKATIKIVVLVDTVLLVDQNKKQFLEVLQKCNVDYNHNLVGVLHGKERKTQNVNIMFATIQSYVRYQKETKSGADLIIIDEVHKADLEPKLNNSDYLKVITRLKQMNPKLVTVGFTATPTRDTGYIYGNDMFFKNINYKIDYKQMLDKGHLVPLQVKMNGNTILKEQLAKLRQINATQKDFDNAVEKVMATMFSDIVETIKECFIARQQIIVFLPTIAICEMLYKLALSELSEYKPTIVHSKLKSEVFADKTPDAMLKEFKSGVSRLILNVEVLTTGFDHPPVDCIILGSSIKSASGFVQRIGRGLRPSEGKADCLVIDLCDNFDYFKSFADPFVMQFNKPTQPELEILKALAKIYNSYDEKELEKVKKLGEITIATDDVITDLHARFNDEFSGYGLCIGERHGDIVVTFDPLNIERAFDVLKKPVDIENEAKVKAFVDLHKIVLPVNLIDWIQSHVKTDVGVRIFKNCELVNYNLKRNCIELTFTGEHESEHKQHIEQIYYSDKLDKLQYLSKTLTNFFLSISAVNYENEKCEPALLSLIQQFDNLLKSVIDGSPFTFETINEKCKTLPYIHKLGITIPALYIETKKIGDHYYEHARFDISARINRA